MAKRKATVKKTSAKKATASTKKTAKKSNNRLLAKLDGVWRKESNIIIWSAAVLLLLLFLNTFVLQSRLTNAQEKQAVKTPKANFNIAVMRFSWRDNVATEENMFKLDDKSKMVAVDTQILNLRDTSIWLAPSIESYIQDKYGEKYGMALAIVDRPFDAGVYEPQQVASGELSYAIPKNISNPKWCYALADSNGGGEPLCFPLNPYAQVKK